MRYGSRIYLDVSLFLLLHTFQKMHFIPRDFQDRIDNLTAIRYTESVIL